MEQWITMKTLRVMVAWLALVAWRAGAAPVSSAPPDLVGYVALVDDPSAGSGTTRVTFDAGYTYFSNGTPREPYTYERLSADRFRVTNYDPSRPDTAWSHLLFAFVGIGSGSIYDEDDGMFKGTFQLLPPVSPRLDLAKLAPGELKLVVTSQAGQIVVLQASTDLRTWSDLSTNIAWSGRWEFPITISGAEAVSARTWYRASVPVLTR